MIPAAGASLQDLAAKLLVDIAPNANSDYLVADTALIAQLLMAYAQEFESAVENRMQDIQGVKALFESAPEQAPGAPARTAFIHRQPSSWHLQDVNAVHDEAMQLLIALHSWAEDNDTVCNQRIWRFLREHSQRHQFALP